MAQRYDVTIVGGGHNALVAAAYLAQAGLRTLLLERLPHTGGAAVSTHSFPGVDAELSRYSYLVSLLPQRVITDLGLDLELRSRPTASYTPTWRSGRSTGLLVERRHSGVTADSFRALTGGDSEYDAWQAFYGEIEAAAQTLAPSLTEPLLPAGEVANRVGADTWRWLAQEPIGAELERRFADDTVRGVVATDALIGTFASLHDESLVQNRCLLYHLIGNGTGEWRVPVGGMGAVTDALLQAAVRAGVDVRTGTAVTRVEADRVGAQTTYDHDGDEVTVDSRMVLSGVAPAVLDGLLGRAGDAPRPEGSQLKINLVLSRLPRWKAGIDPTVAFAGTLHVAEDYSQLDAAYDAAAAGRVPAPLPGEFYCHSLTDPSILGRDLAEQGYQTITYFGVHTPGRLFAEADPAVVDRAVDNALDALDAHLEEPIRDCLATDADGRPCLEVKTPQDVEAALNMPGGHIFHGDLQWPWLPEGGGGAPASAAERWGVATGVDNVLLCGSGARRGGAVSGLGGHNAAHAVLETLRT
ncbi:MAG: phytoene desaturase family protein [Nocardioidaceae bacterium]